MATAKDIRVAPISGADATALVRRVHYSGKVVPNSQLHLGVFLDGRLEGAMQFGPSLDKSKLLGLVTGTGWSNFIELNRMAFSERLPRNSESRAIGVAFRIMRKTYPQLKWVVSFADGMGARMYRGQKPMTRAGPERGSGVHPETGGADPTPALHPTPDSGPIGA